MTITKRFRFPASVHWLGGRLTRATAHGKPDLEVATPPEFKGGLEGIWSPEELLVASVASCFTVTLAAVAERSGVELDSIDVDGLGYIERDSDGRFKFDSIKLAVEIGSDEDALSLERIVAHSERLCIVSLALDVPVHVSTVLATSADVAISD